MKGFKLWWNGQGWAFIADTELREHGRACANLAWDAQEIKVKELEEKLKVATSALQEIYAPTQFNARSFVAHEALKKIQSSEVKK